MTLQLKVVFIALHSAIFILHNLFYGHLDTVNSRKQASTFTIEHGSKSTLKLKKKNPNQVEQIESLQFRRNISGCLRYMNKSRHADNIP